MSTKLSSGDLSYLIQNQMDRYKAEDTTLLKLGKHSIARNMWGIFKESLPASERKIYITNEMWECDRCRDAFYPICNIFHLDEDLKVVSIWKDILDHETELFGWDSVIRSLSEYMSSDEHWRIETFPGFYPAYFEVPLKGTIDIGVEFNDKLYTDEEPPKTVRFRHIHYTVPSKYSITFVEASAKTAKYFETVRLLQ